jgi:hypothetical protein
MTASLGYHSPPGQGAGPELRGRGSPTGTLLISLRGQDASR